MSATKRNLVWLLMAQSATWAITLISTTVVPNYLGEAEFGQLSFVIAYVGFFGLVLSMGTSMLLTREIARDESHYGSYVYNATVFKLLFATVLAVIAAVSARLLGSTGTEYTLILIWCGGLFLGALAEVFASGLAGLGQITRPAFWGVVQVYVGNIGAIVVLVAGGNVVAFGAVVVLSNLISVIALFRMAWPGTRAHRRVETRIWRWLVRAGIPLTILTASSLVYGTIDIPILNYVGGDTQVGWYTLAQRWVGIPAFISTAVVAAFYPRLSSLAKRDAAGFAHLTNRAVVLVLLVAVPAAVGLGVTAADLIQFFYRGKFTETIPVMHVLVLHIPLTVMDTVLVMALLAADRQRRYIYVAAAAAFFNPLLCAFVLPWTNHRFGNAAIGAAIATVATEVFVMIGAIRLRSPGVLSRDTIMRSLRIAAAATVMGVAVWFTDGLPFLVRVAVGIVVYAIAVLVFRPVAIGDLRGVFTRKGEDFTPDEDDAHDELPTGSPTPPA